MSNGCADYNEGSARILVDVAWRKENFRAAIAWVGYDGRNEKIAQGGRVNFAMFAAGTMHGSFRCCSMVCATTVLIALHGRRLKVVFSLSSPFVGKLL